MTVLSSTMSLYSWLSVWAKFDKWPGMEMGTGIYESNGKHGKRKMQAKTGLFKDLGTGFEREQNRSREEQESRLL